MKKIKIFAVVVSVLLLFGTLMPCVLAKNIPEDAKALAGIVGIEDEDISILVSPDENTSKSSAFSFSDLFTNSGSIIDTVRGFLSGTAASATDSEILGALQAVLGNTDFDLTSILSALTGGSVLSQLQAYLSAADTTAVPTTLPPAVEPVTEEPTTEPTTEEPTTAEPTTQAPATTQSRNNNNNSNSSYNNNSYVTPSTTKAAETTTYSYVAPQIVTAAPVTEDNFTPVVSDDVDDGGVSVKMVIGIVILVISGAAVVGVAVVLKKTRV